MTGSGRAVLAGALLAGVVAAGAARGDPPYPWRAGPGDGDTLAARIPPPPGYERVAAEDGSFATWLRGLPLRPPGTEVRLFDGRRKAYQDGAFAVVDIDVGARDLQQCADAVMRLRAEWLRAAGREDDVVFRLTSGDPAPWPRWRDGLRLDVAGRRVAWVRRGAPDSSYACFRRYLDAVFTYAGSASLARDLEAVADPASVRPGDVFVRGGFPGHAVLVADAAEDPGGRRVFLLLQSYMPAQDVHVLVDPADPGTPWYPVRPDAALVTPEWTFAWSELRRFPRVDP